MILRRCPHCNAKVPVTDTICPKCRAPMESSKLIETMELEIQPREPRKRVVLKAALGIAVLALFASMMFWLLTR